MKSIDEVRRLIVSVFNARGLAPVFNDFVVSRSDMGLVWMIAQLDDVKITRIENYTSADLIHQLSTVIGRPVILLNTSGLRYAILMSDAPKLTAEIPYPGWRRGILQLGQNYQGEIAFPWRDVTHWLIAGVTGSGKSTFLRLLVDQAIREGFLLALAEQDGNTFPHLEGHPALIAPLAGDIPSCEIVVEAVLRELITRSRLYKSTGVLVESLEDYNRRTGEQLKPIFMVVDEFSSYITAAGGTRSSLAEKIIQIAWRGRKFGITLAVAGQDFSKETIGGIRDQLTARICFRVMSSHISRMVIDQPGSEKIRIPGRALTNTWGTIQAYRIAADQLSDSGDGMTEAERELAGKLLSEYGGRMTRANMQALGYSQREANRIRESWLARGLAVKDPREDNAVCIMKTEG